MQASKVLCRPSIWGPVARVVELSGNRHIVEAQAGGERTGGSRRTTSGNGNGQRSSEN